MKKVIALSTGGTGGHVFPAICLGEELSKRGYQILWCTDQRGEKYVPNISSQKVTFYIAKGNGIISKIKQVCTIAMATLKVLGQFLKQKPILVVGFGGYTTAPVMIVAKFLNIPIVLHEQNAVLGKVNRWMVKYAKALVLGFEHTQKVPPTVNAIHVGNPVRAEIQAVGLKDYPQNEDKINVFVVGGSQGSALFSHIIPEAISLLPKTLKQHLKITQQAREELVEPTKAAYNKLNVEAIVKPFFNDMATQYELSHLVICRAGAMTVAEVLNAQRPAIFIPLATAMDNHQYFNAKELVEANGAWMINESDFTPRELANYFMDMFKYPDKRQEAALNLKKKFTPNSTVILANYLEYLLPRKNSDL